jgi:hypothetical protein
MRNNCYFNILPPNFIKRFPSPNFTNERDDDNKLTPSMNNIIRKCHIITSIQFCRYACKIDESDNTKHKVKDEHRYD